MWKEENRKMRDQNTHKVRKNVFDQTTGNDLQMIRETLSNRHEYKYYSYNGNEEAKKKKK